VLSPSGITIEYNEKIRPEPDRENAFARASGGGDGSDVEPSLVDAARFARLFRSSEHLIERALALEPMASQRLTDSRAVFCVGSG
jgi:hypothetical protein